MSLRPIVCNDERAWRRAVTLDIELVEVGPRDGLQNQAAVLSPEARAELVVRLVGCGARRIEAVSFVNPRRVPQMAGAEEVMARLHDSADLASQGVRLIGLVLNGRSRPASMKSIMFLSPRKPLACAIKALRPRSRWARSQTLQGLRKQLGSGLA